MNKQNSNSGVSHWLSDHLTSRKRGQKRDYTEPQPGRKHKLTMKQDILCCTSGQPVLLCVCCFLNCFSLCHRCTVSSFSAALSFHRSLFSVLSVWKRKHSGYTCMSYHPLSPRLSLSTGQFLMTGAFLTLMHTLTHAGHYYDETVFAGVGISPCFVQWKDTTLYRSFVHRH